MIIMRLPFALCLVAGFSVALPSNAADHRHANPALAASAATGAPYTTDPVLRARMDGVRNAVRAFEHARHGHMGADQVRALSDHLDAQIARVFADCTLEPRADASLHMILSMLGKASRAMREQPNDYAPVAAMERAVADYARMFDHARDDPAMGR